MIININLSNRIPVQYIKYNMLFQKTTTNKQIIYIIFNRKRNRKLIILPPKGQTCLAKIARGYLLWDIHY